MGGPGGGGGRAARLRRIAALAGAGAAGAREAVGLLGDPDVEARGEAFAALLSSPGDISAQLAEGLGSAGRHARGYCALALANRGDAGRAAEIAALAGDPSAQVRSCAAAALGRLRARGAAAAVLGLLSDPDAEVRRSALHAAAEMGVRPGPGDAARLAGGDAEAAGLPGPAMRGGHASMRNSDAGTLA